MRYVGWMVLGLVACGSTTGTTRTEVPRAADEGAPKLVKNLDQPEVGQSWLEGWFTVEGFPAVSSDGAYVIEARPLQDGARGFPNLVVEAWSVDDGQRVLDATIVSADADGVDSELVGPLPAATIAQADREYAKVRKFLDAHVWVSLSPLGDGNSSAESSEPIQASDGSLALQFSEPTLTVTHNDKIMARAFPEWSTTPDYTPCGEDQADWDEGCACQDPAFVQSVWVDRRRDVLVFDIAYQGNDTCWEPADVFAAMRIPTASSKGWKAP